MTRHKTRWEDYTRRRVRSIWMYLHDEQGRKSRKVAYRKAMYAMGRTSNKPFRKE